ncbi:MAG: hypothetical protein ISS34_03930 [Candidatus Omnitrophica bacterium]|nr:hypothetical protein [Candidatus Omnitrophota bacterium]
MNMARIILILLTIISISLIGSRQVSAQDSEQKLPPGISELPPGMEVINIGSANVIAPIGSKVNKEGTVIIVEPIEQYAGRRFLDMEGRLSSIDLRLNELADNLEKLRKSMERLDSEKASKAELKKEILSEAQKKEIAQGAAENRLAALETRQRSIGKELNNLKDVVSKTLEILAADLEEVKEDDKKKEDVESIFYYEYKNKPESEE